METRANYVLIGAFAAGAVVMAFLFLIWLTGFEGQQEYQSYDVIFDGSVAGLSVGGDVRYNGIKVGEVTDIALGDDPRLVRVRIEVNKRTPVKEDSEARLEFQGITGVAFIEITGGSPTSPSLVPEDEDTIPVMVADRSGIQELVASAPQVLTAANNLLVRLDRFLGENEGRLSATVRDIETVTGTVASNHNEIDETLKNLEKASANLVALSERLNATLETYEALGHDARDVMADVKPAVKQVTEGSLPEVERLLADTRRLIGSVDRLVVEIERNPREFLLGNEPAEYGN